MSSGVHGYGELVQAQCACVGFALDNISDMDDNDRVDLHVNCVQWMEDEERMLENFKQIEMIAPRYIQGLLANLRHVVEVGYGHPEVNAWQHAQIVTERGLQTGDMTLAMSGFFYGLGKARVSREGFEEIYGHEKISLSIAEKNTDFMERCGADSGQVLNILANVSRMSDFAQMRTENKKELRDLDCFERLLVFNKMLDLNSEFKGVS